MQTTGFEYVDVNAAFGFVRCAVARPVPVETTYPLLLCFSDIFGNSDAHLRLMRRFASYGYVVVSPEPWAHAMEPGIVLDFDTDRDTALKAQDLADVVVADASRAAVIDHFKEGGLADVDGHYAIGFCYGGHLAFRAAMDASAQAVVTCYGTGLHKNMLGNVGDVDSLAASSSITGELMMVWGRQDPHIPAEGRAVIHRRLDEAGVRFEARYFDAAHAFMRDVGERYDPAATDEVVAAAVALFRRRA